MDFINSLFGMGTTSVVLLGAFFIAFIGYALGSIQVKGVSLGTAGVFLMALLCGYLFTQPGRKISPFYRSSTSRAAHPLPSQAINSSKASALSCSSRASASSPGRTSSTT